MPTYNGKNVVHGYKKRYGVDLLCAIAELKMLNVRLDPTYIERVRTTVNNQSKQRAAEKKKRSVDIDCSKSNSVFSYIAGYTEGGPPFGLTWEEWPETECESPDADEIPF